jgi:tRNA threonylcarbamoyladenosine biosynthesis protein TsaE
MFKNVNSYDEMIAFGERIADCVFGGAVLELIGDVGAGKTTLTKGIARGLGVIDPVQSPSFTISRVYDCRDGLSLHHYDFYRLIEAGVMAGELSETISDENNITIIEWGGAVEDILVDDRLVVEIKPISENERQVMITAGGDKSKKILERLV